MDKDNKVTMSDALNASVDVRNDEENMVKKLLGLAGFNDEQEPTTINIKRNGAVALSFRIRPLTDDEIQKCRKSSTIYEQRNKRAPKYAAGIDDSKNSAMIIYEATVDEDKKRIWGNKEFKQALGLMQNWECVNKILKPGEKSYVVDAILELSGYTNDGVSIEEYDKEIKN